MAISKTSIMADADAQSASFTVEQAMMVTVALKGAVSGSLAVIEVQDEQNAWQPTGLELSSASPSLTIMSPGTFRLRRSAGKFGAFTSV